MHRHIVLVHFDGVWSVSSSSNDVKEAERDFYAATAKAHDWVEGKLLRGAALIDMERPDQTVTFYKGEFA
jgi:hypothetical protein